MKKSYKKPMAGNDIGQVGLPTVLAIGAVSAAVGAASVAIGKLVGNISPNTEFSDNRFDVKGVLFVEAIV